MKISTRADERSPGTSQQGEQKQLRGETRPCRCKTADSRLRRTDWEQSGARKINKAHGPHHGPDRSSEDHPSVTREGQRWSKTISATVIQKRSGHEDELWKGERRSRGPCARRGSRSMIALSPLLQGSKTRAQEHSKNSLVCHLERRYKRKEMYSGESRRVARMRSRKLSQRG